MPKLPLHLRRRVRRAATVPNVLATLAVCASLTGSAYAAIMVTGGNVRNSTLTGADVKNSSLSSLNFPFSTRLAVGVKGDRGDQGPQGLRGDTGRPGTKGDKGTPAPRAFTFQTTGQGYSARIKGPQPNPAPGETLASCATVAADPWVNCGGGSQMDSSGVLRFPRWNYGCPYNHCGTGDYSFPRMTTSYYTVMSTSTNSNGGFLDMPFDGTILINASAVFYPQRTDSQQRLDCQLQVSRVLNGLPQAPVDVGVPVLVYRYVEGDAASPGARNRQERLLNVSATGAIAQTAGVFETQFACRSQDDSGDPNDRLEFVDGNMSALSTRTNGRA